jgi:hypothetical protein
MAAVIRANSCRGRASRYAKPGPNAAAPSRRTRCERMTGTAWPREQWPVGGLDDHQGAQRTRRPMLRIWVIFAAQPDHQPNE